MIPEIDFSFITGLITVLLVMGLIALLAQIPLTMWLGMIAIGLVWWGLATLWRRFS